MKNSNEIKFGSLIKTSVRIYFKNIFSWILICILVYLPMHICTYLMPHKFSSSHSIIDAVYSLKLFPAVIFFLPSILFNPLGIAAVSFIVQQNLFNKSIAVSEVLDNSLMKWKNLIWTAILYYSIVIFTSFLFIPSIYFSVSFYFYITVIALSKYTGIHAMMISRFSLVGHWFKAAGLIFLSMAVSAILSSFINLSGAQAITNFFLAKLIFSLISEFVDIFFKIILIVWFLSIATIKTDEKEVKA